MNFKEGPRSKLFWMLLILTAITFAVQSIWLFDYPQIDTGMWFGDESWTMSTLTSIAHSGRASVPEALGSTLTHSSGFINGVVWTSGILYGFTAQLLRGWVTPVMSGRIITMLISALILVWVYRITRRLQFPDWLCIFSVLMLTCTPAFFFSAHSARLDALTGLALLLYLEFVIVQMKRGPASLRWVALWGALFVLSLTIYVHVPSLLIFTIPYVFYLIRPVKILAGLLTLVMSATCTVALLYAIYSLTTQDNSLLGSAGNQYYNVANSLPIMHPFSIPVQKINTIDRSVQLTSVAWTIVLPFALLLSLLLRRMWRKKHLEFPRLSTQTITIIALIILGWMTLEGPAVFYNIHVLPLFAILMTILLGPFSGSLQSPKIWIGRAVALYAALITFAACREAFAKGPIGERLTSENKKAVTLALHTISSDKPIGKPVVYSDQPGFDLLKSDMSVTPMSYQFMLFGEGNQSAAEVLRKESVAYLLLYSDTRWHSPLRSVADSLYDLQAVYAGHLTDEDRDYSNPKWNAIDTLRLYKMR